MLKRYIIAIWHILISADVRDFSDFAISRIRFALKLPHMCAHQNSIWKQAKDGLISESFLIWLTCPEMDGKSFPEHFLLRWIVMLRASIFGDVGQNESLSEIKPPLRILTNKKAKRPPLF